MILDEKLKTELENSILKNQRKSKVVPCPGNSPKQEFIQTGSLLEELETMLKSLRKSYEIHYLMH